MVRRLTDVLDQKEFLMRRTILTIAAIVVLAAIAPAYAAQYDTCQVINRGNLLKCVIQNSERSGE